MGLEALERILVGSPRTDVWKKDRVEADQKKDPEFFNSWLWAAERIAQRKWHLEVGKSGFLIM